MRANYIFLYESHCCWQVQCKYAYQINGAYGPSRWTSAPVFIPGGDYIDTGFLAVLAMTRGSPHLQALNKSKHNFRVCSSGYMGMYKNIFLSSFVSELLYQVHKHRMIQIYKSQFRHPCMFEIQGFIWYVFSFSSPHLDINLSLPYVSKYATCLLAFLPYEKRQTSCRNNIKKWSTQGV